MIGGHATFLQNAERSDAVIADSRRAQRGFMERRLCPPFRPGDLGEFSPTSRGESHANLSAMTARPLFVINRIGNMAFTICVEFVRFPDMRKEINSIMESSPIGSTQRISNIVSSTALGKKSR